MFRTLSNDRDGNSKIRKYEHNYARISDNTIENRSNKYIKYFLCSIMKSVIWAYKEPI